MFTIRPSVTTNSAFTAHPPWFTACPLCIFIAPASTASDSCFTASGSVFTPMSTQRFTGVHRLGWRCSQRPSSPSKQVGGCGAHILILIIYMRGERALVDGKRLVVEAAHHSESGASDLGVVVHQV